MIDLTFNLQECAGIVKNMYFNAQKEVDPEVIAIWLKKCISHSLLLLIFPSGGNLSQLGCFSSNYVILASGNFCCVTS